MTGLETGASYVFRVCAVNASGKGKVSDVSEAVCVKALPGSYAFLYYFKTNSLIALLVFLTINMKCAIIQTHAGE